MIVDQHQVGPFAADQLLGFMRSREAQHPVAGIVQQLHKDGPNLGGIFDHIDQGCRPVHINLLMRVLLVRTGSYMGYLETDVRGRKDSGLRGSVCGLSAATEYNMTTTCCQ